MRADKPVHGNGSMEATARERRLPLLLRLTTWQAWAIGERSSDLACRSITYTAFPLARDVRSYIRARR